MLYKVTTRSRLLSSINSSVIDDGTIVRRYTNYYVHFDGLIPQSLIEATDWITRAIEADNQQSLNESEDGTFLQETVEGVAEITEDPGLDISDGIRACINADGRMRPMPYE
jgi:hypothetical protein